MDMVRRSWQFCSWAYRTMVEGKYSRVFRVELRLSRAPPETNIVGLWLAGSQTATEVSDC
jgi:hypothetical protein